MRLALKYFAICSPVNGYPVLVLYITKKVFLKLYQYLSSMKIMKSLHALIKNIGT
jgi:hypothetical protein